MQKILLLIIFSISGIYASAQQEYKDQSTQTESFDDSLKNILSLSYAHDLKTKAIMEKLKPIQAKAEPGDHANIDALKILSLKLTQNSNIFLHHELGVKTLLDAKLIQHSYEDDFRYSVPETLWKHLKEVSQEK